MILINIDGWIVTERMVQFRAGDPERAVEFQDPRDGKTFHMPQDVFKTLTGCLLGIREFKK